jgi:uncharacterized protein (DUF58 family)
VTTTVPVPAAPAAPVAASPESLLRRVELRIGHRLDGVLQGERRGRRPGPGGGPTVTRGYEPGDDVRWIDWPLTARVGTPQVRVPELEPVLTAWALVDCSPSMAFGSVVRTKRELAAEALAGLGVVLRRRGDRLGVVATTTGALDVVRPPVGDRRGLVAVLAAVTGVHAPHEPGRTDLARAVTTLGRVARHRGAVVVISDLPVSAELELALGVLARRHQVIAVQVRDPRERELPDLGAVRLRDMETGAVRLVDTADPRFRRRLAEAAERDQADRIAMLTRVRARHVVLDTDGDWVLELARALALAGRRTR